MARKRGGYREPRRPEPVSNPGSGNRTDGGPTQPVRVPTGGNYGDAKASREQQQSAPMSAGGRAMPSASGGGAPGIQLPDAFGPTQRPHQPLGPRAGAAPQQQAMDPHMLMRLLYAKFPHPNLRRMLEAAQKQQR